MIKLRISVHLFSKTYEYDHTLYTESFTYENISKIIGFSINANRNVCIELYSVTYGSYDLKEKKEFNSIFLNIFIFSYLLLH